jgi:hypothetical protein
VLVIVGEEKVGDCCKAGFILGADCATDLAYLTEDATSCNTVEVGIRPLSHNFVKTNSLNCSNVRITSCGEYMYVPSSSILAIVYPKAFNILPTYNIILRRDSGLYLS